ncbi:MAG: class I SAM-dependent methyltransferase [Bacteroidales bacterium]|nr:class I SAM-dependent methyltransferase [Bacteroidales bacterium]
MQLPVWLDNLIFNRLGAKYCPQYSDMTNIDDDGEKILNYLGTYFPRSYVESYSIFKQYFRLDKNVFFGKEQLSIFDFGCGTGGEIIGLLTALGECFPNINCVRIVALDGNQYALHLYEKVIEELKKQVGFLIVNSAAPVCIDDFYDLHILEGVLNRQFDIIVSFKAICEFVTKDQFEKKNAYEHIAKFLLPTLADGGLMLLDDVTTYNETSQEWLPKMLDKGLNAANCRIVAKNDGYNQVYLITHSKKLNDVSKVAWRMIKK